MVTVICFDSIKRLHRPVKRINTYAHNVLTHDHTSTFLKAICALAGYNRHYRLTEVAKQEGVGGMVVEKFFIIRTDVWTF